MRRALTTLALAASLALAACGGDEETTVVSTTTVSAPTSTATSGSDAAPEGVMTADGIGEASVGDSSDDVIAAFGEPDAENEFPGCELDADPTTVRQLTYEIDGEQLAVNIDAEADEMTSYFTDSAVLETEQGDRVGDSWDSLTASWGAALDPIALGTEKPSPRLGVYKVGPDGENQLIFDLQARTVQRISGGYLPPCE